MMQPSESPCQPLGVVLPTDRDAALSKGDDDVVVVTGDRDHGERKTLTLLSSDDDNPSIPADLLVVAHDQQDTQVCSSPCPAKLIDCSSIWGTRTHTRTQARNTTLSGPPSHSQMASLLLPACVRAFVPACLPARASRRSLQILPRRSTKLATSKQRRRNQPFLHQRQSGRLGWYLTPRTTHLQSLLRRLLHQSLRMGRLQARRH
jgi:hypothetical protein